MSVRVLVGFRMYERRFIRVEMKGRGKVREVFLRVKTSGTGVK